MSDIDGDPRPTGPAPDIGADKAWRLSCGEPALSPVEGLVVQNS